MNSAPILAIDVGTSALKAVLYDENGRFLTSSAQRYSYQTPQLGWAEADPTDWWNALTTAISDLRTNNWNLQTVQAIGLTGQMHTPVLLDAAGKVLPPTVLWLDRRATAETAELTQQLNLPPYRLNSTYTLPKLLWLARHRPEIIAQTRTLLWPKDYLRYRLTGQFCTDVTEAGAAALLDWETGEWAVDHLTRIGLDPAILPPIRPSHANAGPLLPDIVQTLGLPPSAQVIVGAGDIIALIGGAPPQNGRLTCSLGSSCMVASPLSPDQALEDLQNRIYTTTLPPYRLLNGVLSTSGAALTWAWHNLYGEDTLLEVVLEEVNALLPGSDRLFFLPFLAGERSPYWNDSIRGGFYGLTLAHSRAQMMRAVLEGVAYSLRHLVEISEELGIPIHEIALSGGGAMLPVWPQIIADVVQRPLHIYAGQETVTRPLYAYCAIALNPSLTFPDALQRTFGTQPQTIIPRAELASVYEPIYQTYQILADFVANTNLPAYSMKKEL